MPELPEVETIRRGLEKYVVGYVIEDVEIRLKKMFYGDPQDVVGSVIVGVRRFGKGLVVDLDNGYSLAIHVKMTGQLIYRGQDVEIDGLLQFPNKWTHVIFKLKTQNSKLKITTQNLKLIKKNSCLYYNDIRQFGWIRVVKSSKLKVQSFFKSLGPEPLKNLSFNKFSEILKNSRMPIKMLMMDQKKIAGIGNIYANDALFEAKIYPKRLSFSLNLDEKTELFNAIEKVLRKGIEAGGASEWNYVNALGVTGKYQNFFQVYRRDLCSRCGGKIARVKLGGRGTFFCPDCQK